MPEYNHQEYHVSRYQSYGDWAAVHQKNPDDAEDNYIWDKTWDWRDKEESVIEDLILGWPNLKGDERVFVCILSALAFGFSWVVLEFMLYLVFNRTSAGGFTWEVPMDTGLLILFALCGTVLGSVAMWCVTTYRLRTLQLRERKEIRETEYNTKLLEKMEHNGGRLTMRELNR